MKRGFTIVELLAVIVILGIIMVIATPNIIKILNTSRSRIGDEQKQAIENAARAWGASNVYIDDTVPTSLKSSRESVSIQILKNDGFLDIATFNSLDNVDAGTAGVCIKYESNQFVYSFSDNIANCS